MTLYTVTQPNPPVGTDFTFTVPGRYLYDVVGITAQLATAAMSLTVCYDSSGHGNDGTYNMLGFTPTAFVAGLVGGDLALESGDPVGNSLTQVTIPAAPVDWLGDWTVAWWMANDANYNGGTGIVLQAVGSSSGPNQVIDILCERLAAGYIQVDDQVHAPWQSNTLDLIDGAGHFFAVVYTAPGTIDFYVDGAVLGTASVGAGPVAPHTLDYAQIGGPAQSLQTTDEFATFRTALTAGDVAGLYAAASVSFAAYTAAVLALSPSTYYHLNGGTVGTGRQPTLIVTNGTTELEAIPSGFPAVLTPGPYEYSWQPGLNADIQSTDGTLTTVAIPQLLLPAGYTVGTRTLDLVGTDQWTNLALWWDDAYQAAFDPLNDYNFPGGIKLVYQQQGVGP